MTLTAKRVKTYQLVLPKRIRIARVVTFAMVGAIIIALCFLWSRIDSDYLFPVERRHFEKMGISRNDRTPDAVRGVLGEPLSTSIWKLECGEQIMEMTYQMYRLQFSRRLPDESFWLITAYISDPDYRIGRRQLGIGSTKEEVSEAFSRNGNRRSFCGDFGYIDNGLSVTFSLDDDGVVEQIIISSIFFL